jgi:hypothetical protein
MRRIAFVVAALLTLFFEPTLSAQTTPQCIALWLEVEDENSVVHSREIRTPEGKAAMAVQAKRGEQHPRVYLDLDTIDGASGLVRVSVRPDKTSDAVIEEFDLQAGAGGFLTATTPAFKLSVLTIFERVGSSCSTTGFIRSRK